MNKDFIGGEPISEPNRIAIDNDNWISNYQIGRHYFELHITVEAIDIDPIQQWEDFKKGMKILLPMWRVSKFSEDEVDDYHGKWFMSARVTDPNWIKPFLANAVQFIKQGGYEVLRWKAEDTIFDSKHGDTL